MDCTCAIPYNHIFSTSQPLDICSKIAVRTKDNRLISRNALNNLKRILESNGSDMRHVLRVDVLLSDFSLRNEMNAEYIKHFPQECIPARVCYGGVDLAAGCKIEIVAIAKKA
jgi:enamine deaminase RidA (YjgF/YER057c/UK114 family)